jgi:hypothetical protein
MHLVTENYGGRAALHKVVQVGARRDAVQPKEMASIFLVRADFRLPALRVGAKGPPAMLTRNDSGERRGK